MHDVAVRRMVILVIAAILSVVGASLTATAAETTNVVTSVADAGLSELAPTNNGSATTLKVDGDDSDPGGKDLYAALRWDLSQIPAGATVTSATVTLNISNPSPQTYGVFELKRAWSEGQVNWNVAATGTPWATAGAKGATDRGSQIASVTPTNVAPYTFTIPASVVQGWLNDPSSNNGIVLAHTTNSDGFVFDSRDGTSPPKLTINYTGGVGTDTTPPGSTIVSGPSGTVSSASTSFAFSSSEANSTFECRLDGGAYGSCTSPMNYSDLSDGSHTFEVRATDAAGNTEAAPASRTWTVDTTVDTTAAQGDPVLIGAGDIASCSSSGDEATADLLDGLSGTVFTLGDNAYESATAAEYANCYDPSWGRHKARTMPTVGNHEYNLSAGASGYFGYFGAAAGDPDKGYYSYDRGQWHIISLNSMCENAGGCESTSPMVTWLKADLAANPKVCTLAYFHHPLFNSGAEHGNDPKMRPSWDALYAAGAEVVLSGHEHTYERFAPQTPGGAADPAQGIREFVVGTGGASHYPFGTIQPNSQVRNSDTYGVLKLILHPGSYEWQFVPEAGKTFTDSGSDQCHGVPGTADTTAPTVSAVAPTDGAADVAATSNAGVTFSEAMDSNTVSTNTFTLVKQGATTPVTAQVSYDAATRKATLDPNADLDPSATYLATLKGGATGVKDRAGNPLGADKAWSFSTGAAPLPPPGQTPPQTGIDSNPPQTGIDSNPPQTSIGSNPPETSIGSGTSGTLSISSASFAFTSSEPNSTFECSLDGEAFASCSPKSYINLSDGSHTLQVRATDATGNTDATPAFRTWTVDTTAPHTTIHSGPSGPTNEDNATFTFSSEAGATFECSLDGAPFSPCTSPKTYTNLPDGHHTFDVTATDRAGNVEPPP
jgi:hypothetical protein